MPAWVRGWMNKSINEQTNKFIGTQIPILGTLLMVALALSPQLATHSNWLTSTSHVTNSTSHASYPTCPNCTSHAIHSTCPNYRLYATHSIWPHCTLHATYPTCPNAKHTNLLLKRCLCCHKLSSITELGNEHHYDRQCAHSLGPRSVLKQTKNCISVPTLYVAIS